MLTASPSPRLSPANRHGNTNHASSSGFLSPQRKSQRAPSTKSASPIVKPHSAHVYSYPSTSPGISSTISQNGTGAPTSSQCSPTDQRSSSQPQPQSIPPLQSLPPTYQYHAVSRATQTSASHLNKIERKVQMVDAQTQYSLPAQPQTETVPAAAATRTPTAASQIASLQIHESTSSTDSSHPSYSSPDSTRKQLYDSVTDAVMPAARVGATGSTTTTSEHTQDPPNAEREEASAGPQSHSNSSSKRNHSVAEAEPRTQDGSLATNVAPPSQDTTTDAVPSASSKRQRPSTSPVKIMPLDYSAASTRDLVLLISSMLLDLIHYNDTIPLNSSPSHLTRFHSRAPPGISIVDYLQRLTTHATLSPPILLSMVFYIDKLCALYPAFTISSLTVHRFLITAATVASKGLSDSFWTNKTYARVGGVSVKELALLELEFLVRVQWRIVPRPEVLVDYYRSLVGRTEGYTLEGDGDGGGENSATDPTNDRDGTAREASAATEARFQ